MCGYPAPSPYPRPYRVVSVNSGVLSLAWDVSIMLVLILLAINVIALLYASATLIMPEVTAGSLESVYIFTIVPELALIFTISGTFATTVYFLLVFATVLFMYFHFTLSDGKGVVRLLTLPLSSVLARLRSKNRWTMVAQLFLALTFFQVLYVMLLNAYDVSTPAPADLSTAQWRVLFDLANASVYEEIVSRLALIGLPMFAGSILIRWLNRRASTGERAQYARSRRRYLLSSFRYLWGGSVDRKSPKAVFSSAAVLSVFSAVMFGAAHIRGWGDWKFVPALVAGFALAYAFLRGGFLAAVLLHFATDYFSATALIIQGDTTLEVLLSVLLLAVLVLGAGFFLYYCVYFINLIGERSPKARRGAPVSSAPFGGAGGWQGQTGYRTPEQSGHSGGRAGLMFAAPCPNCGWPESLYADGKLKCSKCGREP